jgi:hypothetical protein
VKKLISSLAMLICLVAVSVASATVYPQSSYQKTVGSSTYTGTCTTNFVNGSLINSCHAPLTSGTPVPNSVIVSGTCRTVFVVTQNGLSGEVNEVCKT